jgi:acyl-CoA thioester hydrolase
MQAHDFELNPSAYRHTLRVSAADIDELGHANNVVWVRWVNEAALAHATQMGMGPEGCRALNSIWVVRRHDVEYLLPAFEGQTIEAFTWPESFRGATSRRRTLFREGGRVLARAETLWVLLELGSGRPRRVPPEMLAAYGFPE